VVSSRPYHPCRVCHMAHIAACDPVKESNPNTPIISPWQVIRGSDLHEKRKEVKGEIPKKPCHYIPVPGKLGSQAPHVRQPLRLRVLWQVRGACKPHRVPEARSRPPRDVLVCHYAAEEVSGQGEAREIQVPHVES